MAYGALLSILILLFLCLGLTALGLTWRGRPIPNTRTCRRCQFDLASNTPSICPECGSNLESPSAIVPRRVRSKLKITISLALAAVPLAVLVSLLVLALSTSRLNQLKPVWFLSLEAGGALGPTSSSAIDELTRRTRAGELSTPQLDSLIASAMKLRLAITPSGSLSPNWNPAWSDFLEQARSSGHLSDADWFNYVRANTVITHRTRPKIRTGASSPAFVSFSGPQLGGNTPARLSIILAARLKERRIGNVEVKGSERVGIFGIHKNGIASTSHNFVCTAPPGKAEIRTTLEISVLDPAAQRNKPIGTWTQDFTNQVEVVGPDDDIVQAINKPELAAAIKQSLQIQSFTRSSKTNDISIMVEAGTAPQDLAFDVFIRPHGAAAPEIHVGRINFRQGTVNSSYQAARHSPDFTAAEADIILRPSIPAAEQNPDLTTVWIGPDLIFENKTITSEK